METNSNGPMTTTVILGAGGQLGQEFCSILGGEATALKRAQADLTSHGAVRAALVKCRPDVVINCAAFNLVERAESEPEAAFAVNAWGVGNLAAVCRDLNCLLVHFSTDYVFGLEESRRVPYTEADPPGPINVYGLSKLAGEYLVRFSCPRHFVIRTCGLYGFRGTGGKGVNFVETMLRRASHGKSIQVVQDQTCTPNYTADVAAAALALVQTGRYGLYHVTNAGSCSWYEFARAIFELAGINADLSPTTSQERGPGVLRPRYSVLAGNAYQAVGLPPLRPWQEALASYLRERPPRN